MIKLIKLCGVLFLLASCTVRQKVNTYSAGYSYSYTQHFQDTEEYDRKDSVTINGTVIKPKLKDYMGTMTVQFIKSMTKEPDMGVFAECDKNGNFTIKLPRGSYEISASDEVVFGSVFIQNLGYLGDEMTLKLYTQKIILSPLFIHL